MNLTSEITICKTSIIDEESIVLRIEDQGAGAYLAAYNFYTAHDTEEVKQQSAICFTTIQELDNFYLQAKNILQECERCS